MAMNQQEMGYTKRRLKRVEWDIVKRIVILLHDNNRLKRTNLATKSGLAYDKCALYLDWMNVLSITNIEIDETGFQLVSLSEKGNALYEREFCDEQNDLITNAV